MVQIFLLVVWKFFICNLSILIIGLSILACGLKTIIFLSVLVYDLSILPCGFKIIIFLSILAHGLSILTCDLKNYNILKHFGLYSKHFYLWLEHFDLCYNHFGLWPKVIIFLNILTHYLCILACGENILAYQGSNNKLKLLKPKEWSLLEGNWPCMRTTKTT